MACSFKQGRQTSSIFEILASQASATITGTNGGDEITDADANTNATSLIGSVFEAIQKLDEKNVPTEGRVCIVAPDQYYQLANVDKLVNRDFSRDNGDFGKGTVLSIGGVPIVKSNTAVEVFGQDLSHLFLVLTTHITEIL